MAYGRSWQRYEQDYGRWAPYVSVAERRAQAKAAAKELEKQRGRPLVPIAIEGRTIARSFWGKAWCDNLEAYSDFANRLPRGRTYVRNGSVIDLQIERKRITALVSGSDIYEVEIAINVLAPRSWRAIQGDCARSIATLMDLLQGRFDRGIMERLSRTGDGLFPKPAEIKMSCSCPDYAVLCKHVAAVLYGVGARLDQAPELLFTLRNVDHLDLISKAATADNLDRALTGTAPAGIDAGDLGELFGIELEAAGATAAASNTPTKLRRRSAKPAKARRVTVGKQPAKAKAASSLTRGSDAQESRSAAVASSKPSQKPAARTASKGKGRQQTRPRAKVVKAALRTK